MNGKADEGETTGREEGVSGAKREHLRVSDFYGEEVIVNAEIIGPFAVYRRKFAEGGYIDDLWIVRHVQSGKSVTDCFQGGKLARELARRLLDLGFGWDFDSPADARGDLAEAIQRAREDVIGPILQRVHCIGCVGSFLTVMPAGIVVEVVAKSPGEAMRKLETEKGWHRGMCAACLDLWSIGVPPKPATLNEPDFVGRDITEEQMREGRKWIEEKKKRARSMSDEEIAARYEEGKAERGREREARRRRAIEEYEKFIAAPSQTLARGKAPPPGRLFADERMVLMTETYTYPVLLSEIRGYLSGRTRMTLDAMEGAETAFDTMRYWRPASARADALREAGHQEAAREVEEMAALHEEMEERCLEGRMNAELGNSWATPLPPPDDYLDTRAEGEG